MKNFLSLVLAASLVIIITFAAIWAAQPPSKLGSLLKADDLKVNSSQQMYTNVTGDNLQQATPPDNSVTSSDLSPQKAQPNYCLPGETPILVGCVSR